MIYSNMTELIGKTFEGETTSVNLTMDALERLEEDPVEVFRYFCRDEAGEEADGHLLSLFRRAVEKAEEEQA